MCGVSLATLLLRNWRLLARRCRLRGDVVLVHLLFDDALRRAPCVLCFDDLDALCGLPKSPRDQERLRALKCAWLERVSRLPPAKGAGPAVLVMGVINNPWLLDDDVRGQFELILFAPLPQEADRLRLLRQLVRSPALTDDDYRCAALWRACGELLIIQLPFSLKVLVNLRRLQKGEARAVRGHWLNGIEKLSPTECNAHHSREVSLYDVP
ncbi:hypothetical protein V5799_003848 [Amblyomma americanum]|uniref:ATPase AAA-type core domain-containing protein n=1 Tax=Amblyomma americanum TaxID=6943 RepID=A0AAQ4D7T2_AMBAM